MEKEVVGNKLSAEDEIRSIKQSLSENAFRCRENSEILARTVIDVVNTFLDRGQYSGEELIKDAYNRAENLIGDSRHSAFLPDEMSVIVAKEIAAILTSIIEDFGSLFFSSEARGNTLKDG